MSLILHRCTRCRKPDYWRDGTTAGRTLNGAPVAANLARRCCQRSRWGAPELAPTFDHLGHEIAAVMPPGGSAGAAGSKTCNCDDCVAFYAGLVSAL